MTKTVIDIKVYCDVCKKTDRHIYNCQRCRKDICHSCCASGSGVLYATSMWQQDQRRVMYCAVCNFDDVKDPLLDLLNRLPNEPSIEIEEAITKLLTK